MKIIFSSPLVHSLFFLFSGDIETLQLLLDRGLSLKVQNHSKETVMDVAAKKGNIEVLALICPNEVASDPQLLKKALSSKKQLVINRMIELVYMAGNLRPFKSGPDCPLVIAVDLNLEKVVVKLLHYLTNYFDISEALLTAIHHSNFNLVKLLLDPIITREDPVAILSSSKTRSPFLQACYGCDFEIVKWFLDNFPFLLKERTKRMVTPLHFACKTNTKSRNPLKIIDLLLSLDSELITSLDVSGHSCLSSLMNKSSFNIDLADYLYKKGAVVNYPLLTLAVQNGKMDRVKWILERTQLSEEPKEDPILSYCFGLDTPDMFLFFLDKGIQFFLLILFSSFFSFFLFLFFLSLPFIFWQPALFLFFLDKDIQF